jgi:hypothetical protein
MCQVSTDYVSIESVRWFVSYGHKVMAVKNFFEMEESTDVPVAILEFEVEENEVALLQVCECVSLMCPIAVGEKFQVWIRMIGK